MPRAVTLPVLLLAFVLCARDARADDARGTASSCNRWDGVRAWVERECRERAAISRTPRSFWNEQTLHPRTRADRWSVAASTGLLAAGTAILLSGDYDLVRGMGDIGAAGLPLLALGVSTSKGDAWGAAQFLAAYGTTVGATHLLKKGVGRWRPPGDQRNAYVSGHASSAFAGAAFLHTRYGPSLGVPAYVLATFTALSRVRLERHYLSDVIGGAGLAMITNWLFSIPVGGECRELTRFGCPPRWRIEFAYGSVRQTTGSLEAWPSGTDPSPTARVALRYTPSRQHAFSLRIDPYEVRQTTILDAPLRFDDEIFAAGEEIAVRRDLRIYEFLWSARLPRMTSRVDARAGLAFAVFEGRVDVSSDVSSARVGVSGPMLQPHLHVDWAFARPFALVVTAQGGLGLDLAEGRIEAALRWTANPRWDVGVGYRYRVLEVDRDELRVDVQAHEVFLAVGRSF